METDKQLYEIFESNPQWLFELTELPSPGACRFDSVTVKSIERRCDGVLVPDDQLQPVLITEFQMQTDKHIYNRMAIEMALIQRERPERQVKGMIIFGTRDMDPETEPWRQVITIHYLDELLERMRRRLPAHPLVAVFQPLIEPNRDLLETQAATYYNQIKSKTSEPQQRDKLLSVFTDWIAQRFSERGLEEIEMMLMGKLPHLRDTQVGKDLIAIGIEQGMEKGIEQGMEKGIEQGMEKGIEKGELIGTILTCQKFLSVELAKRSELESLALMELKQMADALQAALTSRLEP